MDSCFTVVLQHSKYLFVWIENIIMVNLIIEIHGLRMKISVLNGLVDIIEQIVTISAQC